MANSTFGNYSFDLYNNSITISDLVSWERIECKTVPWHSYYITGLLSTLLCVFAIFGNIACVFVLSRPIMKSSVNFILLALSYSDLILVLSTLLMRGIQKVLLKYCIGLYYTHMINPWLTPYLFPISTTAQLSSVYLTVLVSVERCVAVCRPFRARIWFSYKNTKILCLIVIIFSISYNIPAWLEVQSYRYITNGQCLGWKLSWTAFHKNPNFIIYYVNLGALIVIRLIPFGLLVVLNWFICDAIRTMNQKRMKLTKYQARQVSVTRMLLCIVIMFLFCNITPIISNILEACAYQNPTELIHISHFMTTLNSAINFIIYCFLSRNFRNVLFQHVPLQEWTESITNGLL